MTGPNEAHSEWRRFPAVIVHLVVWSIPFCIGFAAAMIWQGLVIGWRTAMNFMERT